MQIGVMTSLKGFRENFKTMAEAGIFSCQLSSEGTDRSIYETYDPATVRQAAKDYGITITALVPAWSGYRSYAYPEMYRTLGVCCDAELRRVRVADFIAAGDYAARLGAPEIMSHYGYIPDDPQNEMHRAAVECIGQIADAYLGYGLKMAFETGEMIPLTLVLLMHEVGRGNLGVNFDPANYVINGRAEPVDAMDTLLPYLMSMHIKDAVKPQGTSPKGKEVPVGTGRVDFPKLLSMVRGYGHDFDLTVEREISGPQQLADIKNAKRYLEKILATL